MSALFLLVRELVRCATATTTSCRNRPYHLARNTVLTSHRRTYLATLSVIPPVRWSIATLPCRTALAFKKAQLSTCQHSNARHLGAGTESAQKGHKAARFSGVKR